MNEIVFRSPEIFDGFEVLKNHALVVENGFVKAILPDLDYPSAVTDVVFGDGLICPGFVDLQVNGGGGVMFNDNPSLDTLVTMLEAHRSIGATTILPTLITDTPEKTLAAIEAVKLARKRDLKAISGLHLEGPHLCQDKKGAHDEDLIRPMSDSDLSILLDAAQKLPVLKVTLSPASTTFDQISLLSRAGVVVSLGHTTADSMDCNAAIDAGARCVTHLFNAMSQLTAREPGLVGVALANGLVDAGLIADGIHVNDQSMMVALTAKKGPGSIFLVSDAMATAGSDIKSFNLNNRRINRLGDTLTLDDGTLAGAHLELLSAVRNVMGILGCSLEKALAMSTSIPAKVIGSERELGCLKPGARADILSIDKSANLQRVYCSGDRVY